VPHGHRPAEFSRGEGAAFRRRHGLAPGRLLLTYVGRVAHEKNIEFLLEMLTELRSALPDVLLVIAGEGPALPHLRRRARDLGIADAVLFVGYLSRDGELQDCYAAGDVFVFASRTETQGLVLLEALALGVPVVALPTLGTREIVLPRRGTCPAPDDPAGFAAVVAELMRDPELRSRMREAGPVFAAEWDTGATARRLIAVYEDLRSSRSSSPAAAISAPAIAHGRC
jgi:glycosyltransferase involved in cell wall biosynthesis